MATLTAEFSTTSTSTSSQKFRITQINFGQETFAIKYQVEDGMDWAKPITHDITAFLVQTNSHTDALKEAIKRVFQCEELWGNSDLKIDSLKFIYASDEDKGDPKRGIEPRPAGTLLRAVFAASYQSMFIYSKKDPWITLGSFEQIVDGDRAGTEGFLDLAELKALQGLTDEISRELARKLNERTVFKPVQLKLI